MVMIGNDEIESRFGFHKGTDTTGPMHADVRALFIKFTNDLDKILPTGRAKSVAMTKLEEAAMWSNKAVAELAPVVKQ